MFQPLLRRRIGPLGAVLHVAIIAAFAAHTSAFAGAGDLVGPKVVPLSDNITFSSAAVTTKPTREALTTYAGYSFGAIKNNSGNTINNIRITFNKDTALAPGLGVATFSSAEGGICAPQSADPTLIDCVIGQLKAGESSPASLHVYLKIPVAAAGSTGGLNFSGMLYYAEGTGGVPNSPIDNSVNEWKSEPQVQLGTNNPTQIKSVAPRSGAAQLLFTGVSGIPGVGGDQFTTSVSIPANTPSVVAEITESPLATSECASFTTCYASDLSIPGMFSPYLTIVLRMDSANIVNGTRIQSVIVKYEGNDVGLCSDPTTPLNSGIPCIAKRVFYKNKGVTGWTTELDGDFEWTLINLKNGRFSIL